ncbi:MAG: glycosyltransferase [Actinobacteria bacterium]|nr:glycosyltransferase [Actinomycetota bacterium]MBI3687671.1 glycosyltransferase [Actinomycetota bacterium]
MTGPAARPWVVVSNYPTWPSPYFAELERHASPELRLVFVPDLAGLSDLPGPPGVVNLHRLKRLYRQPDGGRTLAAAEAMLSRLSTLRERGWRIVWTVHNLLPIDGGPPHDADHRACTGVLALADTLIAHTRADAAHLATMTDAPVTVAGWAAPTWAADHHPAPVEVINLARGIAQVPYPVLLLGNLTTYKDLPSVVGAFTTHTRRAHLFLAGPCRDDGLTAALTGAAADSGGRVHLHLGRIPPGHAHLLYAAAAAALCPYRTDGSWEFFTRVLYPASVAAAVTHGTPVIAPDLAAIREMTTGHPRWLYPPRLGSGPALAIAEAASQPSRVTPRIGSTPRWEAIGSAYLDLSRNLLAGSPRGG